MEVVAPIQGHADPILSAAVAALRDAGDDDARLAWLGDSPRARAKHLSELIDAADSATSSRPQTRRLLWILRRLALRVSCPDLAARADYLLARRFAQAGRLHAGLALLRRARQGWSDCGEYLAALRTNLGRMQILTDLGDYAAAVSAGRALLAGLEQFKNDPAHDELSGLAWLNIAACENSRGRFSRALQALERAERFLASGSNALSLARTRNNRGIALKELGRLDEALDCFAAARPDADPLLSAQLNINEGRTRLLKGEYSSALSGFERARAELAELGNPVVQADSLCSIAETYLSLNLYPEALAVYEQLLSFVSRHSVSDIEVQAMFGKARVLAGRRRNRQAMDTLRRTLSLAREMNNGYIRILAGTQWAGLLGAGGDAAAGRKLLDQEGLKPAGAPQAALLALTRARLAADARSARIHLDAAARALKDAPLPFLRRELLILEGLLLLDSKQPESATHPLNQAIRLTERLRRGVSHEPLLLTFFEDKIEPYRLMLEACLVTGNADAALATAERAKARTLVESSSNSRSDSPRDDLPWLELSHVQQRLLEAESPVSPREQLHALVRAERLLGLRLLQDTGAPAPLPETERKIEWPSHPVLVYSQTRDRLVYFLCREGEVLHADCLCTIAELTDQLGDLRDHMERFGSSPVLRQRHGERMRDHARRLLSGLYRSVFAEIDEHLGRPDQQRLTVVPHGFLGLLPFPALHDGEGWLVERYCLSQAPALGLLKRDAGTWAPGDHAAIIASAGFASIPGVEEETAAVSDVLNAAGTRVHRLSQARVSDVFESPEKPSMLHLACHGRFRSDNPMFSGLRLSDRWLTAAEMMERLRHGGRLAVLSACESGRADWLPGDEPLGLPRAFLSAGFQSVVSSLWLADDMASVALNRRFYEDYSTHGDACRALQTAQCAINCDYDDPFYWAGYVLIGRQ